jgi:glycolate dehydrogenase iron-sulfur subunit
MEDLKYISELSKCVRCGSCKASCPTYNQGLTEGMGARGRLTLLRGLLQQQLIPSDLIMERIFSCILCGACESLCPSQVQITEAVYHGRRLLMPLDHRRRYLRHFVRFTLKRPLLSYRVMKMLQYVAPSLLKRKSMPFCIKVPPQPLRDDVQVYKPDKRVGRVGFFTGCAVNFLYPHLGVSLINVLLRLGYEVILPKGEVCCGAPLRGLGLEDEAIEMAEKNQKIFSRLNIDSVLSLCPTCVVALKDHYPKLIGKGIENAMDVSSFFCQVLHSIPSQPLRSIATATYHDPCHLMYSLGIRKEPRQLIQHVGVRLLEAGGEGCCGFGGTFSLQFQEVSKILRDKRIDAYLRTDADAIVTACPGCMIQLSSASPERQVLHVIELVEEAIC